MKTLKRIKLINWHLFSNQTIDINGNTLITGENASGKSTILDALQFVLVAGTNKFNMAANESSTRTVESYARGKLGVEGKEFLRNKDVVSHIALEFLNEESNTIEVLGVVIEVGVQVKAKTHFYKANEPFTEDWFLSDKQVLSFNEFRNNLANLNIEFETPKSVTERKILFSNTLGINQKYNDLIPRALAFRPVDNVDHFMYKYLLSEEEINITDLRESIRQYRELENILKREQDYFILLERLEVSYQKLENEKELEILNKIKISLLKKRKIEDKCITIETKIKDLDKTILHVSSEIERLSKLVDSLQKSIQTDSTKPSYEKITQLRKEHKLAENEYVHNKNLIEDLEKQFSKVKAELKLVDLKIDIDFKANQSEISEKIVEFQKELQNIHTENMIKESKLKVQRESLTSTKKELEYQVNRLTRRQQVYPENVKRIIRILNKQLSSIYREEIEIKPLFELIDIKDEKWRNAVEGYLNTQRFNLIVPKEYFDSAIQIYDQLKVEYNLYGVKIIDVKKLSNYPKQPNSLATVIKSLNQDSENYINYLLGKLIMVDNVSELSEHNSAITASAMVYKGYAVYAINPVVYSKPYIGQKAIEIQLKNTQLNLMNVEKDIENIINQLGLINSENSVISNINFNNIIRDSARILNSDTLLEQLELSQSSLEKLESDPDITRDLEIMEAKEKRLVSLNSEYHEQYKKLGALNHELQSSHTNLSLENLNREEAIGEVIKYSQEYPSYYLDAEHELTQVFTSKQINTMINQLIDNNVQLQKSFANQENSIRDQMFRFNQESSSDYGVELKDINMYLDRYYNLRDVDLIDAKNKARIAREKSERQFEDHFVYQLQENIKSARKSVESLNQQLKKHAFKDEKYSFSITASKNPDFAQYYPILSSNKQIIQTDLFTQKLSDEETDLMKELFRRISSFDNTSSNEKDLKYFTDYRNYMSYDIITTKENGDVTRLSSVIKEKSGGETQTPFYVTIAASFEQQIPKLNLIDSGCVVLFDEAFNNMDSERIRAMLEFYNSLSIQIIIAVPPERIPSISDHVDTILAVTKSQNHGFVSRIQHGKV